MYQTPGYSPWGKIQHRQKLCAGVHSVSTESHGGIMVNADMAEAFLSQEAIKCGFRYHNFYCFEEDCDAPVAIRELMDKGLYTAPVNDYFKPGEYEAVINSSLQTYRPDYWQAREKTMNKQSEKRKEQER